MFDRLESLLPKINQFLKNSKDVFTLKELKDFIELKNIDDDILASFLVSFSLAYFIPDLYSENGVWTSKCVFFSNREFPIQISKTESEMRIFIPGSRFLPFLPVDKYAHNVKIFYNGQEIPKKRVYLNFDRISSFYFLYTENDISHVLCEDWNENIDIFSNSNTGFNSDSLFAISAWDFSDIFDEYNFDYPVRLFVRIKDWSECEFEILEKRPILSEEDISSWFKIFEDVVKNSLTILPMDSSTHEVISFSYFLGDDRIFSKKAAPMELFFERKSIFGIVPYGIEEKFWIVDAPIKNPDRWFEYTNFTDSASYFFTYINRPITESIIDFFVLDFLSTHYMERFDDKLRSGFVKDTLSLFVPDFMNNYKKIFSEVGTYLEDRYDYWIKYYNPFQDDFTKDLRTELVCFYKNLLLFFNEISQRKLKPSDFKGQSPLMLYQIFTKIFQWCEFVTCINPEEYNFLELMSISLENLSYTYNDVKVELTNEISAITQNNHF